MDETILFPSPNWFQVSGLAVTNDGWLAYGGPSKTLCVMEPLPVGTQTVVNENQGYRAHVVFRAHPEKIVSVDVSPEWPEKRHILTGGADGTVKQWNVEIADGSVKIKATHSQDFHHHGREGVIGAGYSQNSFAITVGSFGNVAKWDLMSNVAKTYHNLLKNFKPTCMACSHHLPYNVAVGTKQGVVFVLDLYGVGRVVYKVRCHDDDVLNVSWCPQFEVSVKKAIKEFEKPGPASQRMERMRNKNHKEALKTIESANQEVLEELIEPNESANQEILEELIEPKESVSTTETKESTSDGESQNVAQAAEVEPVTDTKSQNINIKKYQKEQLDESGIAKDLPDDSFDNSVVQEEDLFDMYKDHEADEFGHKKYQPENIYVKVKEEETEENNDYLAECLKLKEEILKKKSQPEPSIESLVDKLEKTRVDDNEEAEITSSVETEREGKTDVKENKKTEASDHIHKHLLATIGKHGSVRIWSKAGKLVGSCAVSRNTNKGNPSGATLLWYKPDTLLIGDPKNQLVICNPLLIDSKNKLEWKVVHSLHRRGMYCVASNAPRIQTSDQPSDQSSDQSSEQSSDKSINMNWDVWTVGQDRNIIRYSLSEKKMVSLTTTCGGFVYSIQPCPYDARKVAISVGDGAIRVWQTDTTDNDDTKLKPGQVFSYWQNVQGMVLTVAWHPTKENLLAFGTAESRIGLIDTSKPDKPARTLPTAFRGGVYCMCWGENNVLYACAAGELVRYKLDEQEEPPVTVAVELDGQKWEVSAITWTPTVTLCGSNAGAVGILSSTHSGKVETAVFPFSKMIHSMEWHPQQTSLSNEESPYKHLVAVCSGDKVSSVEILEYETCEDGTRKLQKWKTLSGHKAIVHQIAWNPHVEGQLVSTSQDATARVWNISDGTCTSIFAQHTGARGVFSAAFSPFPALSHLVMTGGGDGCLRLWSVHNHPATAYPEPKPEGQKKERKKKEKKEEKPKEVVAADEENEEENDTLQAVNETKAKFPKKFLLPICSKQMNQTSIKGARKMLEKYMEKNSSQTDMEKSEMGDVRDVDFIKLFGTINDVNELLDMEMERHQDTGATESWIMLAVLRGQIDLMMQFAAQRNLIDPYILSIVPCVSVKYWKDATQQYLAQIDRLVSKGETDKLYESRTYGGPVYRKMASLLSLHDIKSAVNVLTDCKLYKEAYVLCRIRYMDSIAEETLKQWAAYSQYSGDSALAAVCYIGLENLQAAATVLGRSKVQEFLSLAADLAKLAGINTFADHIEEKKDKIKSQESPEDKTEEILKELPSRIELLLKETDSLPSKINDVGRCDADGEICQANGEKCDTNGEKCDTNGETSITFSEVQNGIPVEDKENISENCDNHNNTDNKVVSS